MGRCVRETILLFLGLRITSELPGRPRPETTEEVGTDGDEKRGGIRDLKTVSQGVLVVGGRGGVLETCTKRETLRRVG